MKITIDGKEIAVEKGQTVLQVCLASGINVPYFCWHPKLSIAGNCRMCLVDVEGGRKPAISCNTPVQEGMVVRTNTPQILKDRQSILEFILINHPLDCPICDQAGECDLQDQYFDHSAVPYRFREQKVKKPKAVPLGDLVVLDDERCILCTRCVRFCDEVAGVSELAVAERGDHSTITTFQGQGMKNAYSLNTVDICPVGALTNRDFRFNKRVWYLQKTASICTGCATGCNVWLDHEGDVVYRYRPRENDAVNECWMCDEGRLSYKYVNAPDRIDAPYFRDPSAGWQRTSWNNVMQLIAGRCKAIAPAERGVVLSAQCSNEENQAWHELVAQQWKSSHLFTTRRCYANPSEDTILRHADKNPNSAGLALLGVTASLNKGPRLLVVLDTLTEDEIAMIKNHRPDYVIVLATNWGTTAESLTRWRPLQGLASPPPPAKPSEPPPHARGARWVDCHGQSRGNLLKPWHPTVIRDAFPWADLVLPLATFAEQGGTFTNAKGMQQRFDPAIAVKGLAEPAWQIAARFAQCEGATGAKAYA